MFTFYMCFLACKGPKLVEQDMCGVNLVSTTNVMFGESFFTGYFHLDKSDLWANCVPMFLVPISSSH